MKLFKFVSNLLGYCKRQVFWTRAQGVNNWQIEDLVFLMTSFPRSSLSLSLLNAILTKWLKNEVPSTNFRLFMLGAHVSPISSIQNDCAIFCQTNDKAVYDVMNLASKSTTFVELTNK